MKGNSFTHKGIPTNVPFEYVFKLTDGANYSKGVVKGYTRPGATSIQGVAMSQLDKVGGYDAFVQWEPATDATSINFSATNGNRNVTETLDGKVGNHRAVQRRFGLLPVQELPLRYLRCLYQECERHAHQPGLSGLHG